MDSLTSNTNSGHSALLSVFVCLSQTCRQKPWMYCRSYSLSLTICLSWDMRNKFMGHLLSTMSATIKETAFKKTVDLIPLDDVLATPTSYLLTRFSRSMSTTTPPSSSNPTLRVLSAAWLCQWSFHKLAVNSAFLQTGNLQRDTKNISALESRYRSKVMWLPLTGAYGLVLASAKKCCILAMNCSC